MMNYEIDYLNSVYREIAQEVGIESALKLFHLYKGTTVSFPTKLMSKTYVYQTIRREYDGSNIRALALKYNYSERNIRRIIKGT